MEKLWLPEHALELFTAGRPSHAVWAWREALGWTQQQLADAAGMSQSTLSARLNGQFAWKRAHLLALYEVLSKRTSTAQADRTPPDPSVVSVGSQDLLERSGLDGDTVKFEDTSRARSPILPDGMRVGIIDQDGLARFDAASGTAHGILPELLGRIRRRSKHFGEIGSPRWVPIDDIFSCWKGLAHDGYDLIMAGYPVPYRSHHCHVVEVPGLRLPLNGIVAADSMRRFASMLPRGFSSSTPPERRETLHARDRYLRVQEAFFQQRARFVSTKGELGYDFLAAELGEDSERVVALAPGEYNVAKIAEVFKRCTLDEPEHPVAFVGDDVTVLAVASALERDEEWRRRPITTIGRPFGTRFGAYDDDPEGDVFHFDLGLPTYPVGIGVALGDERLAAYLQNEMDVLLDQEPHTLIRTFARGYAQAGGDTEDLFGRLVDRTVFEPFRSRFPRGVFEGIWPDETGGAA